jgi:hypothetical protein
MSESKINVTKPFIAIREDLQGSDYDATMGEYLCNPLNEELLDVEISTGGFYSDQQIGVITSDESKDNLLTVPAGSAVRFALSTWDEYQEYVLHWSVRYRTATKARGTYRFGTFKSLKDCEWMKDVPCLGGPGCVVPG